MIRPLAVAALLWATAHPAVAQVQPGDGGILAASRQIAAEVAAGVADGAAWTASAVGSMLLPAAPGSYLPDQWPESDRAFLGLMQAAGYRLAAVETGGMILAHVAYRFVQERQLSEADRLDAVRALEAHRAAHRGIAPSLHRWVVESVLEAGLSPGYRVAAVTLTTRPLPSLAFQAVAVDQPQRDTQPKQQGSSQ
ncbi:MAG: hypothetical protein AB7O45_14985 [Alphaproteobacteria bacterium]